MLARTPSSSIISVDLYPIDMREFPNNLNRRGLFPTMRGDIKKNFKQEKSTMSLRMFFLEELPVILMKPLTIWIAEQIEIFS